MGYGKLISQENKKGLHNPWFLGMMGLMAVVLGVNGVFIGLAMENRPVLVDHSGTPVSGTMEATAYRASDANQDFTTTFSEISPAR